jgi:hypothetical protein
MRIADYGFCRVVIVCAVVFVLGINIAAKGQQQDTNDAAAPKEKVKQLEASSIATQDQQQDTNDVALLKEKVKRLEGKIKAQEDIIRRATARINELERQLTEQTKQNNEADFNLQTPPEENAGFNRDPRSLKPARQTNETKDAARVERLSKKINDSNEAIELCEHRIKNLPPIWLPDRRSDYNFAYWITEILHLKLVHLSHSAPDYAIRMKETLDTVHELTKLLYSVDKNYNEILRYGEKYSDLGIDVIDIKKNLIDNQGKIDMANALLDFLRQDVKENRARFNIVPN